MVRMRCLQRAHLPAGILTSPSPASIHSNRLAAHVFGDQSCHVYFSSGIHTYQAKLLLDDKVVIEGKESLLIPTDAQIFEINQFNFSPHRAEIQSVCISQPTCDGSVLLGTADSRGRIVVSCLGAAEKGATYTACPQDAGVGEGGWAGLAFVPRQPSLVAVARGLAKSVDFYDKDLHVRTLHTQNGEATTHVGDVMTLQNVHWINVKKPSIWYLHLWSCKDIIPSQFCPSQGTYQKTPYDSPRLQHPTSLTFLDGSTHGHVTSSILAITEGSQLSIWDLRASENGGCMQRILGSSSMEPLYAVCSNSNGLVGTGGAERCAVIFDQKKWTAVSRWTNCLKYEITGMAFSALDRNVLYVHGLDYEVICGQWNGVNDGKRQCFAFRGDSRWLGFNKCSDSDVFAGWCEAGSIFAGEAV